MPVFSLVSPSISLAASGSNSNAANTIMAGFGLSVRASSHAISTWRCSKQAVLGAKGDHDALRLTPLRFSIGVQPARAGQRLNAGEVDVVAAFAAKASFQQFVAPFACAAAWGQSARQRRQRGVAHGGNQPRLLALRCNPPTSMSSSDLTVGAGTASTVNGPVTRTRLLSE